MGFHYDRHRKTYYNDKHVNIENKQARKSFISQYFEFESLAHRWVQVLINDALLLEEENLLMKDIWAFQFQKNGKTFREYHVDCHPNFLERYVTDKNKQFGGNLSHCFPEGLLPMIIIGNDKSVFKENTFSAKAWHGSEGQLVLCPKDDGHRLMISAYVSWAWAFNVIHLLTEEKLVEINQRRRQPQFRHYLSADAANRSEWNNNKTRFG